LIDFFHYALSYADAISEGRLPLCSASSEAGALPSEVRIEDDSDRKLSKIKSQIKSQNEKSKIKSQKIKSQNKSQNKKSFFP